MPNQETINFIIKWLPQIISAILAIPSIWALVIFYKSKLKILSKNINREIHLFYFSSEPNHNLEMEKQMIEQSNLFRLGKHSNQEANLQNVSANSLVVLGYTEQTKKKCNKIIDELIGKNCPIIIYTYGNNQALKPDELTRLQNKSSRITLCNFSMSLMTNIFTVISTYNYD